MIKNLILSFLAVCIVACGGAPEGPSEADVGTARQQVLQALTMQVRLGTHVSPDYNHSAVSMTADPSNTSAVARITVVHGATGAPFGEYNPITQSALLTVGDALQDSIVQALDVPGTGMSMTFVIVDDTTSPMVTSGPKFATHPAPPVTVSMNVTRGTTVGTGQTGVDMIGDPSSPNPNFVATRAVLSGATQNFDITRKSATLSLSPSQWAQLVADLNAPGRQTRITLTYDPTAVLSIWKPLVGSPAFSLN